MMTIEDAILYVMIIWPIGIIFLYFLFGKWMGPNEQKGEVDKNTKR